MLDYNLNFKAFLILSDQGTLLSEVQILVRVTLILFIDTQFETTHPSF